MELLKAMFSPPCLPATIVLGLLFLYWLGVIIGWLDIDGLDFDLEWDGLLTWLGWKGTPMAVCASVVAVLWWGATMVGWRILSGHSTLILFFSLGSLVASVFASRLLLKPFGWFFAALSDAEAPCATVDCFARLVTPLDVGQIGQAEISTNGASLLINVVLERGKSLPKGARVVVSERREDGLHVVIPSTSDNPEIP